MTNRTYLLQLKKFYLTMDTYSRICKIQPSIIRLQQNRHFFLIPMSVGLCIRACIIRQFGNLTFFLYQTGVGLDRFYCIECFDLFKHIKYTVNLVSTNTISIHFKAFSIQMILVNTNSG